MQTQSEPPASAEPLPLELGGTAPIPLELGGDGPAEPFLELGGSATTGAERGGMQPSVVPVADQTEPIHTEVDELGNIVLSIHHAHRLAADRTGGIDYVRSAATVFRHRSTSNRIVDQRKRTIERSDLLAWT